MAELEIGTTDFGEFGCCVDVWIMDPVRSQGLICNSRRTLRDGTVLMCGGDLGHEEDHWAYGKWDNYYTWKHG